MRPSDIEAIVRLERVCQPLPWSASAFATEIGNPNAYYAVAKTDEGQVVGYGGIWVVMDELHVTTLGSEPALRGRKIGEKLLLLLLEQGIRMGATRATLEVRATNVAAIKLYIKYKFAEVSVRRAYYSDNKENALIMWAEEIASPEYRAFLADRELALSELQ